MIGFDVQHAVAVISVENLNRIRRTNRNMFLENNLNKNNKSL